MIYCFLRNHNYVNEVQVASQVFFPGEKFAFVENISETGFTVESMIKNDNTANTVIYENGIEISRYIFRGENEKYLNIRRIIILSIYHALQKAVGAHTPWGALTGIRPSKLVREWLDDGYKNEKIILTLQNPFCCTEEKAQLALAVAHAEKQIEKRIRDAIGIYVSIPFCPSRCVYCSFNTSQKPADKFFLEKYISAVISEFREKVLETKNISSIYIGGGTPTFLPENLLEKLLFYICEFFYTCGAEFTVEAGRPDTITAEKLKILRKYNVSRIAINPQTLNDHTLKAIGRSHSAADFFNAFLLAREAGFTCINTDFIAGLPGETPDDMYRSMESLQRLSPENITIHTLAIKRASIANSMRISLNGAFPENAKQTSGEVESMLSIAAESCAEMGLSPYYLYRQKNMVGLFENVGYSKPSNECLYNVGMMAEVQTVLGFGAGAVSKYVIGNKITRDFNAKNPEIYIERRSR